MLEALNDPYSQYLTEEEMDALSSTLEGQYVGISVTIDLINGEITVLGTFSGSPAEKPGIKPGDVIVGVDGKDLRGKTVYDASAALWGTENTQVTVEIERLSTGQILTFKLTRAMIIPPTLSLKDMGNSMFYVQIRQFTSSTGQDFSVIMNYLRSRNLGGLILDLRGNPGGLLDSAIAVAKELVAKGPIVELRRKDLKEVIQNDNDITPVPVAVLTDSGTVSASEIVAGAIRDRGVGVLIGEKTFGKACVQSIAPLGNGMGGIRLTIADYYTPPGSFFSGYGPPTGCTGDARSRRTSCKDRLQAASASGSGWARCSSATAGIEFSWLRCG